jgi:hypothetical protein
MTENYILSKIITIRRNTIMEINFNESSIVSEYTQNLISTKSFDWDDSDTHLVYEVLTSAMSEFLGTNKSTKNSTAIVLKDLKGNFMLAATIKYYAATEEGMPGNWGFAFTLNEEDVKEIDVVYEATDLAFLRFVSDIAFNNYRFQFNDPTIVQPLLISAVEVLRKWLDCNAKEGETVSLVHKDYFEAAVAIEDGVKVFSFTPDGKMKSRYAKDDKAIEIA